MANPVYAGDLGNQPWSAKCVCGKRFMQPNSFALHTGCCDTFKRRLSQRLRDARQKRQHALEASSTLEVDDQSPSLGTHLPVKRTWSGKTKLPSWIDDDNLDVDVVFNHSGPMIASGTAQGSQGPMNVDSASGSGGLDLGNRVFNAGETPLANPAPVDTPNNSGEGIQLGRGHRVKTLSYKVQANTNFQPSSTLPTSLYPPELFQDPSRRCVRAEENGGDNANTQVAHAETEVLPNPTPPIVEGVRGVRTSRLNAYGLYKRYWINQVGDSPHDPDNSISPEDLRDPPTLPPDAARPAPTIDLHPFPNMSSYKLGSWFWSDDGEKSQQSFRNLIDIVGSEEFNPAEVRAANWAQIDRVLAASDHDVEDLDSGWVDDGISWKSSVVTIQVPLSKTMDSPGAHPFTVQDFHYRPLIPVIRAKLECSSGREYFHTEPHELRWNPGTGKEDVRVYGEMYNSDEFIRAHEELQRAPPEVGCDLPRYVVGLMFASDGTMLANFGTAKLWPLYMLFANDSKYRRAKPSEGLFETMAYFEKLPDKFKDFIVKLAGKSTVPAALLTHCQRELFHEQWKLILDNDFVEAYCHGIVVTCYDGLKRRFYPRIFTYSADYPEKILLASIKNLGLFPCPRCHIPMKTVPKMGQKRDRALRIRTRREDDDDRRTRVEAARGFIYKKGHPLSSQLVDARLAHGSLVPTANAFSEQLSEHGFDLFKMLVVDLMHEVELGVWKALFIQLLRLLEAGDKGAVNTLDARFRLIPTFGKDTIRRFTNNVSEMKQMAARDFEDLLQCAIPAFEGLFPAPHDRRVTRLLSVFAKWHGMAKLRLHTDHTLTVLDTLTTELGDRMRGFVKDTCSDFDTKELPREFQARKRREAARKQKGQKQSKGKGPAKKRKVSKSESVPGDDESEAGESEEELEFEEAGRKRKTLNLNTYKFHSLGDVVPTIRLFGTTDSYSTQIPERFHKYPKLHYKRTSKKHVSRQLSRIQMRQARIRKLRKQLLPDDDEGYIDEDTFALPYFMGKSQNRPVSLPNLVQSKREDPAMKDFIPKLQRHLLPRIYQVLLAEAQANNSDPGAREDETSPARLSLLKGLVESAVDGPDFLDSPEGQSDTERIHFHSDRLYEHSLFHINYTSYDLRRETDIVNPKTSRRDVMCLRQLNEDEDADLASSHRFVHARVLHVFHTNVIYRGRGSSDLRKRRFDILLVRWYRFNQEGPNDFGLDRVHFHPLKSQGAVGFIDPADVVRASHVIPRFSAGKLYPEDDARRIVSKMTEDCDDWKEYYINRFVDRDMLMRYMWGHGIGHLYSHSDAPSKPVETGADGEDENMVADELVFQPSATVEDGEIDNGAQDTLDDLEAEELDVDGDDRENGAYLDGENQEPDDECEVNW